MKTVQIRDIYQLHEFSGMKFAPNGKHAVFTVKKANEYKNGYDLDLWLWSECGVRPLTATGNNGDALWLDDDTLLFPSSRAGKKDLTCYYTLSISGGEARLLTEIPGKISSLMPIGDGRYFCLLNEKWYPNEKPEVAEGRATPDKDYLVFDEIPYWWDGRGIINKLRNRLCIWDGKELQRLTDGPDNVKGVKYSSCGKAAFFTMESYENAFSSRSGLYCFIAGRDEKPRMLADPDMKVASFIYRGDGRVYFGCERDIDSHSNEIYYHVDLKTGKITPAAFNDMDSHNMVAKDGVVYGTYNYWHMAKLAVLDDYGRATFLPQQEGNISTFDVYGDMALIAAARGTGLPEIYTLNILTGEEVKVSSFHDAYLEATDYVKPDYFTFLNRDGIELEAHVLKPAGYEPGRRCPGILIMHGGPKGTYNHNFTHDMQVLAAKGYFVFYTNPRGSDGRGEAFADVTEKMGTIDINDFMDLTDTVLARYPDIDPHRLGCTGGSYGGFTTNWIIGHTDRFKAAVSQRSISNYITKIQACDIGTQYDRLQVCGKGVFAEWEKAWANSPLKYAHNAKTPTLFVQSEQDYRTWLAEGVQMFTALQMNGVPSKLVCFKGESHGLVRIGKPHNRVMLLEELCAWMDQFLK